MGPRRATAQGQRASAVAHRCSILCHGAIARSALMIVGAASWGVTGAANAQVIRQDFYVTDGTVHAVALSGNTLYIGGEFGRVGPSTGGGIPIDKASGTPASGFPKVLGSVIAVASDGAGGWYIGGGFTTVGGMPRSNLAHILADNTVSPWDPSVSGVVATLVVNRTTVYAGGVFSSIGGQARNYLAALDATTGLAPTWDPNPDGQVNALAVDGTTVYAGGYFTSIGGQARNDLAALDAATGLATAWNPAPLAGSHLTTVARAS